MNNPYPTRGELVANNAYWLADDNRKNVKALCDAFAERLLEFAKQDRIDAQDIVTLVIGLDGKPVPSGLGDGHYKTTREPMTKEYVAKAIFEAVTDYILNLPSPDEAAERALKD